jgi:Acyl-CoA reductase (LuxC)
MMRAMRSAYRVWGSMDGSGLVIRSAEPVEFHPVNKTVNVVVVPSLRAAVNYANVATQTVGIYPEARKAGLRDALASAGAQRIVNLGSTAKYCSGSPHDAMMPLHRFVHWMVDESI